MAKDDLNISSLLSTCREIGMRKTKALVSTLRVLVSTEQPVTLQQIAKSPDFDISCDPATVYRLVTKLVENRIVRRIGFHSRAAHYCLRVGYHQDYLICRGCGSVEVLEIACPVEHLEAQIAKDSGYADLEHELEFYGRCTACN
jgi:Fur family ferric uptake transcriptional regulator